MASSSRPGFLDLSPEIRREIYGVLFCTRPAFIDCDLVAASDDTAFGDLLPVIEVNSSYLRPSARSAQVLRVCRTTFHEASPIFMERTPVIVNRYADVCSLLPPPGNPLSVLLFIQHLEVNLQAERPTVFSPDPVYKELLLLKELQSFTVSLVLPGWWTNPRGTTTWKAVSMSMLPSILAAFAQSSMKQFLDESIPDREIRFVMYQEVNPAPGNKKKLCLNKQQG